MRIVCDRKSLLAAIGAVGSVVPPKSPKAVLTFVRLAVHSGVGATLSATDMEVGVTHEVVGVSSGESGVVLLPTSRIQQILAASTDQEITIETEGEDVPTLVVSGARSKFRLPTEDPDIFPEVPAFTAADYHEVATKDLRKAIRRTMFATDPESTRYALGGCLFECKGESLHVVATDGRRLARQILVVTLNGTPEDASPVLPLKALKLLDRVTTDYGSVRIAFERNGCLLQTAETTIYTRLVEGRFPRYQDVFPASPTVRVPLTAGPLLRAVTQAAILTSNESRGVDLAFGGGVLVFSTNAADVGQARVELPIDYAGDTVELALDPRYLTDALKALPEDAGLVMDLIDHKSAAVLRTTDDEYAYVLMPLTRDR